MPAIPNDPTKPNNFYMGPTARLNCVPTLNRLEIHLTYRCTLKCPNCISLTWQAPTNKEMTVEQIQKLVDDSKKLNWKWEWLVLHGGESALHPRLREICKILSDYKAESNPNVKLILCTGGYGDEVKKGIEIVKEFNFEIFTVNKTPYIAKSIKHLPHLYSPEDMDEPYTLGCNSPVDCGQALNSEGFFVCTNAAAASRVFNFPPVATELKDVTLEKMIESFSVFCKHCGFSRPWAVYNPTKKATDTWKKVLRRYNQKTNIINLYTFHRSIIDERFDQYSTRKFIEHLEEKGYKVNWQNLDGIDKFTYKNDCEVLINQGSISIIEFNDTKHFKTYDFGDAPTLSVKLSKSKNFIGASIGQYNETLWDETIKDSNLRKNINPGPYPETFWQFGITNYEAIQQYRKSTDLNNNLCWRGSIYENPSQVEYKCREYIKIISQILKHEFHFGNFPTPFDSYINECLGFKLILCSGVGGGYTCGDHCLRDIELYGIGIPTIRPKYITKNFDPLIPDYHYISVDAELDEKFRYKNPEKLASDICEKYKKVIKDNEFLDYIAKNAREWYIKNLSYPNITNNIIKSLGL